MASDISKYLGNKIARWLGGQAMPTAPINLYMALFVGDPKGAGTEVTTTIRSTGRPAITWTVPASNDVDNVLVNSAAVDWGVAENDADGTSHVAIFDASSGGKRIASKALLAPVDIKSGTPVSFGAGDVNFVIGT